MELSFEVCSDILQFTYPAIVGFADVIPDFLLRDYEKMLNKVVKISGLILLQSSVTMPLKRLTKKPRPSFPDDLKSFPSGHMMITMQCTTRVFFAYTGIIPKTLAVFCSATVALGRYIPGRHDLIDLSAGGLLGVILGTAWNRIVI